MIWMIIAIFITCYILPAILCYGLALPYVEYLQKTTNIKEAYFNKNGALHLAFFGPIGLWAFLCADSTKYCGFRFIRKYTEEVVPAPPPPPPKRFADG